MKRRHLLGSALAGSAAFVLASGLDGWGINQLGSGLFSPGLAHADADLRRVINRADMVMRGSTSAAVMSMEIKTKSFKRNYEMVSWTDERGGKDKSLIKILGPASFRGFGTLKIGNQLKLYDPKTNHVQVVGNSMLGSSWMGSHFSNDDLVKETKMADHFTYKLISKTKAKKPVIGEVTVFKFSLTPKPNAPVAWGRIDYELWDGKGGTVPISSAYFQRPKDKRPERTMTFSQLKKMAGRVVPAEMKMTVTDKPGEYTKVVYRKLKLDVKIPGSKFTEAELRR